MLRGTEWERGTNLRIRIIVIGDDGTVEKANAQTFTKNAS